MTMSIGLMGALALCVIIVCYFDLRWLIIPDWLNVLILALGGAYRLQQGAPQAISALVFGTLVFGCFWLLRFSYWRLRGVVGLGLGDVKLAGAAAVWLSPLDFPLFLFLASLVALIFLLITSRSAENLQALRYPFGPFLAASLLFTLTVDGFTGQYSG